MTDIISVSILPVLSPLSYLLLLFFPTFSFLPQVKLTQGGVDNIWDVSKNHSQQLWMIFLQSAATKAQIFIYKKLSHGLKIPCDFWLKWKICVFKLYVPEINILFWHVTHSKHFLLALKSIKIVYLCNKQFPWKTASESLQRQRVQRMCLWQWVLHGSSPPVTGRRWGGVGITHADGLNSATVPTCIVSFGHFQ